MRGICSVGYHSLFPNVEFEVRVLMFAIAKSKKQRKIAAKALRKQEKLRRLHPEWNEPKVPLYEQSVDLPAGDGSIEGAAAAQRAREELTKSMREKRRAKIKEDNFMRTM